MQYWDNVLYPKMMATIRGDYYSLLTQDALDNELYYIAVRAVNTFKFPRILTTFETYYAKHADESTLIEIDEDAPGAIPHAYFVNDLTDAELEVILAWMKFYWCESLISNSNNFQEMYTDSNIKTFSRANAIDKNMNLMNTYREYARDIEQRYSRVTADHRPTIGRVNGGEDYGK